MRRSRGLILALTILLSAALFFFALMFLNLYRAERQLQAHGEYNLVAWEAASAGIAAAALQLKAASTWNAGFNTVSLPASGATYSMTFTSTGGQPYSTNNAKNTSAVTGWDGRTVPAGAIHLVSVGRVGTTTAISQALVVPSQAPYGFALFGTNGVTLGAYAKIDGYDSSAGPYPGSATAGSIGTNTVATGKIALGTGSVVSGNVRVGVGGSASVIKGSGAYSAIDIPTTNWPASPVSAPMKTARRGVVVWDSRTLAPGAYRDVYVYNNATLTLQAGTYVIRNLTLGSNASITLASGPVDWWFSGTQNIGANARINENGQPKSFNMKASGTPQNTLNFENGATAWMSLYAPFSNLNVAAGANLYGSFLAKNITLKDGSSSSNAKIHADTTLFGKSVSFTILTEW